jgi:hypothetical protein
MDVGNGFELFRSRSNMSLKKFARHRTFLDLLELRRSVTVELLCRGFAAESINPR